MKEKIKSVLDKMKAAGEMIQKTNDDLSPKT